MVSGNAVRRHRPDYMVTLFMGLLMMLGLVVIYAIGPQRANVLNNAYGYNYSDTYFFIKQITSLIVALGAFAIMFTIPFSFFIKRSGFFVVLSLFACLLLAVAGMLHLGIAQQTLGATRWFNLGPLGSIQPSEFLKFSLLLFLAGFLGARIKQGKINDINLCLIPLAIASAISLFFIVIVQKDLGTGISLICIILAMLFVGGINLKNGLMIFGSILVLGVLMIVIAPHRMQRIATFMQGDNTSGTVDTGGNYHIEHAKIAIGTGGLFGVGIGNSIQATGYLPEAINDSVFAIMGETFGFVGLVAILAIFFALLMRLLKIMDHLIDPKLKLFVAGVFGWMGSHVVLNIASMLGLAPLTGITLPLLSFGGTSLAFIAGALGAVLQLSCYTVHSSKLKETISEENLGSRRRVGRTRHTSSRSIK